MTQKLCCVETPIPITAQSQFTFEQMNTIIMHGSKWLVRYMYTYIYIDI